MADKEMTTNEATIVHSSGGRIRVVPLSSRSVLVAVDRDAPLLVDGVSYVASDEVLFHNGSYEVGLASQFYPVIAGSWKVPGREISCRIADILSEAVADAVSQRPTLFMEGELSGLEAELLNRIAERRTKFKRSEQNLENIACGKTAIVESRAAIDAVPQSERGAVDEVVEEDYCGKIRVVSLGEDRIRVSVEKDSFFYAPCDDALLIDASCEMVADEDSFTIDDTTMEFEARTRADGWEVEFDEVAMGFTEILYMAAEKAMKGHPYMLLKAARAHELRWLEEEKAEAAKLSAEIASDDAEIAALTARVDGLRDTIARIGDAEDANVCAITQYRR